MKALQFDTYGPPSVLAFKDLPTPEPAKGEVLIKIKAAGINPSDVKNVAGHFKSPVPRVPGRDYAGVVVGGDAEKGMEVWGSGAGFGITRDGAHAEYIIVPKDWLSPKPVQISMEQAAAVGVPYLAAWSALINAGNIQAGETVLIVGVSGAVGRAATQIAHWKKARVIGADTSTDNPSGADAIIDTKSCDLPHEVRALTSGNGVDLVLDAVGGPMFEPALNSLRPAGRQIAIASGKDRRVNFDLVSFYHNRSTLIGVDTNALTGTEIKASMNELSAGFQQGYLEIPAVTTYPFAQAVSAYEAVEAGRATAKEILVF
jgi:NADPH:quinone reductase